MLEAYFPFAVIAICAAPWLLAMSRRFGLFLALGGVLAGALILLLAVQTATPTLKLAPLPTTMTVAVIAGVGGIVVLRRTPGALRRPQPTTLAVWAPACVGGLAWIAIVGLAHVIPGAAPLSWAMNGDTANNIHIARAFLENDGLPAGYGVPLSSAMVLLGLAGGRDGSGKAELLQHDLVAFTALWTLELALTAVLLGLVAAALVPAHRNLAAALASAGGSLLATTWFVAGLPIEYGYLNVHLALPFLLASWLAFLHSSRFPIVAIAVELGLGVLLLTTWTPLIVFTVVFAIAILLRHRPALRVLRGRSLVIVAASTLVFLVPFAVLAVPTLSGGTLTLLLPGHGMPFTGWLLPLLIGVIALGAVLLRRRSALPLVDGAIGLGVASLIGIGVLLFIARQETDPWSSYYPAKLTWLVSAALVPIALAFAARLVVEFVRPKAAATLAVAVLAVCGLALASAGPPPTRASFVITPPLQKIALGSVWSTGDAAVEKILRYSRDDRRDLLWATDDPDEAIINFWILEFSGGDTDGDEVLRDFALRGYRELRDTGVAPTGEVSELCAVAARLEPPVYVHTADAELASTLGSACPEVKVTVRLDGSGEE